MQILIAPNFTCLFGCKKDIILSKGERNVFMNKNLMSCKYMSSSNSIMNPNAREAMNKFKIEAASEVGVSLKQGYNGDLTSKQAGSIGGQMVKKMIESYENSLQ